MEFPGVENEVRLWSRGYHLVAGIDEAGRGCLAGPVVAAAVIFPKHVTVPGVCDSKMLSAEKRSDIAELIRREAISIGIGMCSPAEIDDTNILKAAMEAMRRAACQLSPAPDYLLIDGNRAFDGAACPLETIIKGDRRCHAIAAASIIAKTTRDEIMRQLHDDYPVYGWQHNVGYPTRMHYEALAEHGPSPYHRFSFRLYKNYEPEEAAFSQGSSCRK